MLPFVSRRALSPSLSYYKNNKWVMKKICSNDQLPFGGNRNKQQMPHRAMRGEREKNWKRERREKSRKSGERTNWCELKSSDERKMKDENKVMSHVNVLCSRFSISVISFRLLRCDAWECGLIFSVDEPSIALQRWEKPNPSLMMSTIPIKYLILKTHAGPLQTPPNLLECNSIFSGKMTA